MELFDLFNFNSPGPFVTEASLEENLDTQRSALPLVLSILVNFDKTGSNKYSVDFFFYTNAADKASDLVVELSQLGYDASHKSCIHGNNQYVVFGCTPKIDISRKRMGEWVEQMCKLGFKHDCAFDGWGMAMSNDSEQLPTV